MTKSSVSKRNRWITRAVGLVVLSASLAGVACSGRDGGTGEDGTGDSADLHGKSRYSIKVLVPDAAGKQRLVELSPQNATLAKNQREQANGEETSSALSGSSPEKSRVRTKEQDLRLEGVEYDGVSGAIVEKVLYEDVVAEPGIHQLANWVSDSCRYDYDSSAPDGVAAIGMFATHLATSEPKFSTRYIPNHPNNLRVGRWHSVALSTTGQNTPVVPKTCDEVLFLQSQLLCTASKLTEMADAVAPVELLLSEQGGVVQKIIVPPQASSDRYLLRRLGVETLAAFATASTRNLDQTNQPCVYFLSLSLANPGSTTQENLLFDASGTAPFAGFSMPGDVGYDIDAAVNSRALLHIEQHRAANELRASLVETATSSAIGQAELLRAEGGLTEMWGENLETTPNSLRGAAATLLGRLEIDSFVTSGAPAALTSNELVSYYPGGDPQCAGAVRLRDVKDENDLLVAAGAWMRARIADAPPKNLRQQRARDVVEKLGLVVPVSEIVPGGLKSVVRGQLPVHDARLRYPGESYSQLVADGAITELENERGTAYDSLLEGLAEEDLVFGMKGASALYVQLTDSQEWEELTAVTSRAGLNVVSPSIAGPGLQTLSGNIVSSDSTMLSGLPREALNGSMYPRMARVSASSQCAQPSSVGFEIFNYQDPAMLGVGIDTQMRRITAFSGSAEGLTAEVASAFAKAKREYAEREAFDGIISVRLTPGPTARQWDFSVIGSAAMAGVPTLKDLGLRIVYGLPFEAECVAGTRSLCGSSFPQHELTYVEDIPAIGWYGWDRYSWRVAEVGTEAPIPTLDVTDPIGEKLFFVVRPSREGTPGRVLAALKPIPSSTETSGGLRVGISRTQREGLDRVFGASSATSSGDMCLEGVGTALPEESCIFGIQKDQYVPLSNELTSSGGAGEDSWKHYLSLAKEAAEHADELGRQIIELGTTRDLRSEAAQEELASICGSYTDLPGLDFDDGGVDSDVDSAFNDCTNPQLADVVFFQGEETAIDQAQAESIVKGALGCATGGTHELCGNWASINPEVFSLGLDPPPAPVNRLGVAGCRNFLDEHDPNDEDDVDLPVSTEPTGLQAWARTGAQDTSWFRANANYEHYSDTKIGAMVGKLKFVEFFDGRWGLFLNGTEPILAGDHTQASDNFTVAAGDLKDIHTAFPLCQRVNGGAPCSAESDRIAKALGLEAGLAGTRWNTWYQLELHLRRIAEGGLWHAARLSGNLPRATFQLNLPAYNYAAPGASDSDLMELPAIYSRAKYVLSQLPEGDFYGLDPSLSEETSGNFFGDDYDKLGALQVLPSWLASYKGALGGASEYYPREAFYTMAAASTNNPKFLAVPAVENSPKFFSGGVKSYPSPEELMPWLANGDEESSSLQEYGVAQWIQAVLNGKNSASDAFFSSTRALNNGNNPRGNFELIQNGVLQSYVVRRKPTCKDKKGSDGTLGEIMPYDGPNEGHLIRVHEMRCDGQVEDPEDPFFVSDADGWVNRDCAMSTSLDDIGTCDSDGNGLVTCSPGSQDWPKASGRYDEFNNCIERTSNFSGTLMSVNVWPPDQRVHMYIDPGPAAFDALVGMGLLSCLSEGSVAEPSQEIPVITQVRQIPALRRWIDGKAEELRERQAHLFLVDVPEQAVEYFRGNGLHGSVGSGDRGDKMLELAQAFQSLHDGFSTVYSGVRAMSDAIRSAEVQLTGAEIQRDIATSNLAVERINTYGRIASSLLRAASSFASMTKTPNGAWSAGLEGTAALSDAGFATATLGELSKQGGLNQQQYDNSADAILQGLSEGVAHGNDQAEDGMSQIKSALFAALRAQNALDALTSKAGYQAARASGADAVDLDGDGVAEEIPINIVYRRRNDILLKRYQRALESAKRYAFLAKLSIEQRLGVRMESLSEDVGPVPPPSSWVANVCEVTGVDYADLRTLASEKLGETDTISEEEIIDDFADQYIGDYVRQLEEFVEFYNVKYPFREDDDVAVLSLRDDLVYGNGACRRESHNLLFYSDELATEAVEPNLDANRDLSVGGWTTTRCDLTFDGSGVSGGTCLAAQDRTIVAIDGQGNEMVGMPYSETEMLQAPPLTSGLTLLAGRPVTLETYSDPLEPEELTDLIVEDDQDIRPRNAVYQTLWMGSGDYYLLSWQDLARNALGEPTSDTVRYRVMVANESWSPVFAEDFIAKPSNVDEAWSQRHLREIFAPTEGYYHLIFQFLEDDVQSGVALSGVQLEFFNVDGPREYEPTSGTRIVDAFDCGAGNPEMFRNSFVRTCSQGECYYELTKPIQLTDRDLADGRWELPGIAEENYNYRHATVALNVVGTGVLDCSASNEGCYANGFVEYDLVHSAYNAALRDYANETRCFNFGMAEIKHAKALTAERFLGVPLSSSDVSLIQGADFSKAALHGRPLTGTYTLRIHETPAFRWENVEDIQLVLNYRYWSRVSAASN